MNRNLKWAAPALLAASLAMPTFALAQSHPATPAPAPAVPATHAEVAKPGTAGARVEKRIADLHAKLHITSAQKQQWDQFADVMRENAQKMDQTLTQRSAKFKTMSAIDNMQSYAALTQEHAEDMQKLFDSFKTLYASLSDQQKHMADQVFRTYSEKAQARKG